MMNGGVLTVQQKWSYTWEVYKITDGLYTINVRSWDGIDYSKISEINLS
jgi:hypothetical protein